MRYEFKLPDIGEGLTEAEIVEWRVKEGDSIKEDDPLLDLQTDKAIVEITSPHTGKIVSVAGMKGQTFPVGSVLVVFEVEGEEEAGAEVAAVDGAVPLSPGTAAATATNREAAARGEDPVKASPHTRKVARESGVDLSRVTPTGPKGRALIGDVEAYAAAAPSGVSQGASHASAFAHQVKSVPIPHVGGQVRIPLKGLRRAIAEAMVRSVTIIPHATSFFRCNGETFLPLRKSLQESYGARISFTAMVMKAMVPALKKYPYFNASVDDQANEIVLHSDINIGFATHTEDGLIVPVIKNVAGKTVAEISAEIDRLASLARERKIGIEDLRGQRLL